MFEGNEKVCCSALPGREKGEVCWCRVLLQPSGVLLLQTDGADGACRLTSISS